MVGEAKCRHLSFFLSKQDNTRIPEVEVQIVQPEAPGFALISIMTSTYSIEQPYALFTLPRPIDTTSGRTIGGTSCSINGKRKRKRTETVIAVDGESLSVYDVCELHVQPRG